MRKLYVVPKDVWLANLGLFSPQIGSHYVDLVDVAGGEVPTSHEQIEAAWANAQDITATMVLMSGDFHHEMNEDAWEALGAVAVLPHPTFEGNIKLKDITLDGPGAAAQRAQNNGKHPHEGKKFKTEHANALKKLRGLGFDENDTVLELSKKSAKMHPLVKVRGLR